MVIRGGIQRREAANGCDGSLYESKDCLRGAMVIQRSSYVSREMCSKQLINMLKTPVSPDGGGEGQEALRLRLSACGYW